MTDDRFFGDILTDEQGRTPNGSQQAVYNGWPLYRNVTDDEPGDSSGDNETDEWGSWFVVMLDEPPPDPTPTLPGGAR